MDELFTGYSLDNVEADKECLTDSAEPFSYGSAGSRVHEEVDPRENLRVENQGPLSSCTANSITTGMECLTGWQSGDFANVKQLSRWYAYINGQKRFYNSPNGRGLRDNGCGIDSMVVEMRIGGTPEESLCPYPRSYTTSLPSVPESAKFKIGSHSICNNFDEAIDFCDSLGFVYAGIPWQSRMQNFRGQVMTYDDVFDRGSRSGHAISFVGFVKHDGEDHLILCNSHGTGFGIGGYALMGRKAFDYLVNLRYSVFALVSDMVGVKRVKRSLKSFEMG